ncbi:MAG: rnase iii domain [Lasallia pustulata]|uniref:Ribonuclease III domain n=1 Tax=Lasallia pustulata TaxID=136370 RepID=A0A1W5D3Z6_9LECA|nr:MAG: rnase iii domain [Lasallia pustulata]SLM37857.1 Ribonuclease III domain [Lasallia pustulata]
MVAPFRSRPRPLHNTFYVNEDPRLLDQVYIKVLGSGGQRVLTEEVKWLAVTHKSFDHGRRGYNDRLAFLGKRIVDLQTSLAMVHSASSHPLVAAPDPYGRTPFQHPALEGLEVLSSEAKLDMTDRRRLAQIAEGYGLADVIRWKPRQAANLEGSGIQLVLMQALYAIVGAVALQKGGEAANRVTRKRILNHMGLS